MTAERRVDQNLIRTKQVLTISLLALAFVLDLPLLAVFVGLAMLIEAIAPPAGLFGRLYRHVFVPLGVVQPDVQPDHPEPHRFAQFIGGTCISIGMLALAAGAPVVGWGFVALVIALASINLFAGWCAGCMMYYWLNRLGVPGFDHSRREVA